MKDDPDAQALKRHPWYEANRPAEVIQREATEHARELRERADRIPDLADLADEAERILADCEARDFAPHYPSADRPAPDPSPIVFASEHCPAMLVKAGCRWQYHELPGNTLAEQIVALRARRARRRKRPIINRAPRGERNVRPRESRRIGSPTRAGPDDEEPEPESTGLSRPTACVAGECQNVLRPPRRGPWPSFCSERCAKEDERCRKRLDDLASQTDPRLLSLLWRQLLEDAAGDGEASEHVEVLACLYGNGHAAGEKREPRYSDLQLWSYTRKRFAGPADYPDPRSGMLVPGWERERPARQLARVLNLSALLAPSPGEVVALPLRSPETRRAAA